MSRSEWRDAGKERLWRRLVRDWERSGLAIRDFCAERGLAEHNFHAWRRTLVARDKEKALPPFVPVQVVNAIASAQATEIEIIFPDGVVVRVRAGVDEATLRLVLALWAKERPC
jgi:hypothetical protein